MFKAGYVALVGKPNAGKSSLLNAIIGEKVAIVSNKPQTTRNNILGILTREDYQIIFVDTPGVHHSKNLLDKAMMKNVRSALAGVNLTLYLVDGSKKPDEEELDYINHLEGDKLIVKTKSDLPKQQDIDCDITLSAKTGENVQELITKILQFLPEYDEKMYIYPPDYYTDKSVKFLIAEEIREKALELLHQEIPHGIAVEIIRFYEEEEIVYIDADIVCEEERHKGMIIGKGGSTLKQIGVETRKFAKELLGKNVMLKLFVKVEKDWRNKPQKVKNLGY
ncbi:MAG: GTPase Era [Clostridia bacterium]|nr:GTPase Era [Clostridia bacterium]